MIFPLVLIILGVGWFLGNAGVWDFGTIFSEWWPLLIVIAGIVSFASNPNAFTGPLIIVIIGGVLLFSTLDLLEGNVWTYMWPLIIIAIGLSILFNRKGIHMKGDESSDVRIFVAFSGQERRVTSSQFAHSEVTALFGGAVLDLRNAGIQDGATVQVFAAFGGVDILVPRSCKVDVSGLPLFGGWDDKTTPDASATNTLHIRGTVLFGGVGVKHEK